MNNPQNRKGPPSLSGTSFQACPSESERWVRLLRAGGMGSTLGDDSPAVPSTPTGAIWPVESKHGIL